MVGSSDRDDTVRRLWGGLGGRLAVFQKQSHVKKG